MPGAALLLLLVVSSSSGAVIDAERAADHAGETVELEGTVHSAVCSPLACLLSFGSGFSGLLVRIPASALDQFPPIRETYSGRIVRVAGKVEVQDGKPRIEVVDPADLTLAGVAGAATRAADAVARAGSESPRGSEARRPAAPSAPGVRSAVGGGTGSEPEAEPGRSRSGSPAFGVAPGASGPPGNPSAKGAVAIPDDAGSPPAVAAGRSAASGLTTPDAVDDVDPEERRARAELAARASSGPPLVIASSAARDRERIQRLADSLRSQAEAEASAPGPAPEDPLPETAVQLLEELRALRQEIAALGRDLEQVADRVSGVERALAPEGVNLPPDAVDVPANVVRETRSLSLRRVAAGWTAERVKRMLGEPIGVSGSVDGYTTWDYGSGHAVTLDERGRVVSTSGY